MSRYFLDEPVYDEPHQTVLLVLKNNIVTRRKRRLERISLLVSSEWSKLSEDEKKAIEMAFGKDRLTTRELSNITGRSVPYARKILLGLAARGFLQLTASSNNDPQQYYCLADMQNE